MKKFYNKELKSAGFRIALRLSGMTGSEEQGRSMVEMLGVLAVIGVLSVAGIAGYSNAMKKHRANEILNEASKRAVLVAAQAMAGKTGTISLGEFTQNTFSGVTFAGTANVADNKITLELSGTGLADICDQLKNATGDNGVMKITQDDCSVLTFNADMSVGTSTPSGPTVEDDETAPSGPTVEEDATVDSCPEGSSTSYSKGDLTTKLVGNRICRCANATPIWNGTACEEASTTKVCNSSTPCGSGEYCRYKGASGLTCYSNTAGYPVTSEGGSTEVNGTCEKVAGVKKTTNGEFYYSRYLLDWFSAKSWCEAIGMNLVTRSSIAGRGLNQNYENGDGDGPLYTYFGQYLQLWTGHVEEEDLGTAFGIFSEQEYESIEGVERDNDQCYAFCE